MQWEVVIGLETHAQLSTVSKIFSGASTAFGAEPNTQACGVDIALPGVLPVLNMGAVERAIRFGLAVGAKINSPSIFARKNYFYPDLPKGYQISQYELPIVEGGTMTIRVGESEKIVRLTRAHLEEDAGKSLHEDFHGRTGIDLNRAGTPLLEIVSEPDMRSAEEAVAYARALHALVRWIDVCDGNMQEGSFRCDANVSVRPAGSTALGTRREIKNLNSFRFLQQAIEYEAQWQIGELEEGRTIQQATVLFNPDSGETRMMRTKEDAHDYRYFPDPDLLPLEVTAQRLEAVRAAMPELPQAMRTRFVQEHRLAEYDALLLTASQETAVFFEETTRLTIAASKVLLAMDGKEPVKPGVAKLVANWINGDISSRLNAEGIELRNIPITPGQLAKMLARILDQKINNKQAKVVLEAMWSGDHDGDADRIIAVLGLEQISDGGEIEKIIDQVLAANARQVADFKSGKEKAFNSLVGQVMKASRGKANPQQVNDILRRKLAG
ncbi:MAG: Asp-tRNA(Asn)/Glu-tRNA(Gln) amidotransferase subunit GatB [Burkholderiales bacterium]